MTYSQKLSTLKSKLSSPDRSLLSHPDFVSCNSVHEILDLYINEFTTKYLYCPTMAKSLTNANPLEILEYFKGIWNDVQ